MNSITWKKAGIGRFFVPLFSAMILATAPLGAVAAIHEIMVLDTPEFSPSVLTIEVGDTVRWVNPAGGMSHDVHADDNRFHTEPASSFIFEWTFYAEEDFRYHCHVHSRPYPVGNTQNGIIYVVAGDTFKDVSVESVNVDDGAYKAGETIQAMVSLRNVGTESTGLFNVGFYASTDSEITQDDTFLGNMEVSNIEPGVTVDTDESIVLPEGMVAGDYFIGAISDLVDTNSGNNTNADDDPIYVFTTFTINAGLNDAWYEPATDGQGFFITVFPGLGRASFAWFTYDTELPAMETMANLGDAGHRWITGAGPYADNQGVINIVVTSGGIFDTPGGVQRTDPRGSDGTVTLTFENCNSGTVEYDITSINMQGTIPIQRVVAGDNVTLCNTLLRETQMPQAVVQE